jgi:DNA-binding NarL/FixJ family response regulator
VSERFLIVDDNEEFLQAASSKLEAEGVEVVGTARTGTEAVRKTSTLRPDVVLLDISLAEESGFEVARRLVDVPGKGRRVVLISTRSEEDFTELIEESAAVGFVSKAEVSAGAILALLRTAG